MAARRKKLDLSDDRLPQKAAEPVVFRGNILGPIFRGKRTALGLGPADIGWIQPRTSKWKSAPTWVHYEDGDHGTPPGGWDMWFERLNEQFAERVAFMTDLGQDPYTVRLNPWSLEEIRRGSGYSVLEILERERP